MPINPLNKITIAMALTITATLATAESGTNAPFFDPSNDCVLPEIAGYNKDDMSCKSEGFIFLRNEKGRGVFNQQGKVIVPVGRYDHITEITGGLIGVANNSNTNGFDIGFVSQESGEVIIPLEYVSSSFYPYAPSTNHFSEGLVAMKKPSEKWGYLDNKGKTIIPFTYIYADSFSEDLAAVCQDDEEENYKCGYIDKTNKTVIPFIYEVTKEFSEGLATVSKIENEKITSSVIDKNGVVIYPFKEDRTIGPYSEGLAPIVNVKTGRQGFIDRSGKLVIPYLYMPIALEDIFWLPSFEDGKAQVIRFGAAMDQLCIDTQGVEVSC